MSAEEKLIQKILSARGISYKDAEKILLKLGFDVKITASHHIFRKKGYPTNVSLKRRAELLSYQIKLLQEVLKDHGYQKEDN
jgi:predicted RNA binding protein YcfA (HicA-like mRNA interferase family)